MLQEFIALVERYDPGYSRRLRGAGPEEIRNLEVLAGQPLPDSYREFLTRMGRDMGGLEIEGIDFHIERILEFYKSGDWPPPRGYILFAIQEDDPQMDYYLECTRPGQRDCPVVRFPSMGEFSRDGYFDSLDPSLNDFLLSLAFSEKRMEDFDRQRLLTPSTKNRKQAPIASPVALARIVDERAQRLGFERVARTSVAYRFYDRADAALYVRLDDAGGLMGVTVAARTPRELERISDILGNQTSLVVA
ncbi:MAG TPA: SMI1/KNR4 family protein [Archangium sp.]|uniref:SMI1/KNR4 family protein n=1 Tax=Archangium sp. TaxID=1872627 RepID=UPI002E32334B|nr:SMI1/KNR4 family protein [Archangium sp.]HEX5746493.1 SMI1/KNR4 family protein [Archangium sp.]